jgi:hypothetical protein
MLPLTFAQTQTTTAETADPSRPHGGKGPYLVERKVRHVWLEDGAGKVTSDSYDESGKWLGGSAYAFNSEYGFFAARSSENGPYAINHIGYGAAATRQSQDAFENATWMCRVPEQLITSYKTIKVTSCRRVRDDGLDLIAVGFTLLPPPPTTTTTTRSDAVGDPSPQLREVFFDPSANWRLVRETSLGSRQETLREFTYSPQTDDFAALRGVVFTFKSRDAAGLLGQSTDKYEFSEWSHAPIPDGEFRLSSIGLTEPATKPTGAATQGASSINGVRHDPAAVAAEYCFATGGALSLLYWLSWRRRARHAKA